MKEGFLDDVFERKSKTSDRIGPALIKSRAVAATTATPDRDPSWVLIEGRAQGFWHEDLRDFAQLLASDRERWQATAIDTLNRIGPHLEEGTGHRFDDEQKGRLINSMTEVLQQAVRE